MSKNPNSPSTGHASNPSAIPAPMQPPRSLPKQNKVWSRFNRRIQAIPLSTKLVTCIIVLLTIGTIANACFHIACLFSLRFLLFLIFSLFSSLALSYNLHRPGQLQ